MTLTRYKLFGIGLPKTGTSSLAAALRILGLRCLHNPWEFRRQAFAGRFHFEPSESWDAIVNFGERFYPQLDAAYPGSKFILTLRDKESWLESIHRQFGTSTGFEPNASEAWVDTPAMREGKTYRMSNALVRIDVFGCHVFQRDRFSWVHEEHERMAIDYFRNRSTDFLALRIDRENPWRPLCDFLGVPVPDRVFPHERPRPSDA